MTGSIHNFRDEKERPYAAFFGATIVMLVALVLAELIVFNIYIWLEPDAIPLRMSVTGIVTAVVSFPIGFYFHHQNAKLKAISRELAVTASTDYMSGLQNRTSFLAAVQNSINMCASSNNAGSFLFIDADHFKALNDCFGHATGDDAIGKIGDIINEVKPESGFAGRIGGEEFGVYLPKADIWSATSVAEKIRRRVRLLTFENKNHSQRLSVSIGVARFTVGQTLSEFVQIADARMYDAKATGRNRIVFEDVVSDTDSDQISA